MKKLFLITAILTPSVLFALGEETIKVTGKDDKIKQCEAEMRNALLMAPLTTKEAFAEETVKMWQIMEACKKAVELNVIEEAKVQVEAELPTLEIIKSQEN